MLPKQRVLSLQVCIGVYDSCICKTKDKRVNTCRDDSPKLRTHQPKLHGRVRKIQQCIVGLTWVLGPVSRKSRKPFGPEKPFLELRPADSVKLVFSYVVKGIKIKITAKFRVSRRLRFEDTKRIMSPETCPKSVRTFEKRAPGQNCQKPNTDIE